VFLAPNCTAEQKEEAYLELKRLWGLYGSCWPLRPGAESKTPPDDNLATYGSTTATGQYLMERAEALLRFDEPLTKQDVLMTRTRVNWVRSSPFQLHTSDGSTVPAEVWELGIKRTSRRKWIRCFDSVSMLIFVVELAGYLLRFECGGQIQFPEGNYNVV